MPDDETGRTPEEAEVLEEDGPALEQAVRDIVGELWLQDVLAPIDARLREGASRGGTPARVDVPVSEDDAPSDWFQAPDDNSPGENIVPIRKAGTK